MGKTSSTIGIALIFFECVRDEGATDQFVVGDKVARIPYTVLPYYPPILVEKIVRSRLYYFSFAFLMPS